MMKWGACLDVSKFAATVQDYGGAVGVWNAAAGTFTVTFEASSNGSCGGSNTGPQWSKCTLKTNGFGALQVAIAGEGETKDKGFEIASVERANVVEIQYSSVGGNATNCAGAALKKDWNNGPLSGLCPCEEIELKWDTVDHLWHNAWQCVFTLSVHTPPPP